MVAKNWKQTNCPSTNEWMNKFGISIQWNTIQQSKGMKYSHNMKFGIICWKKVDRRVQTEWFHAYKIWNMRTNVCDRKRISSCLGMRLRAGGRDCKGAGVNFNGWYRCSTSSPKGTSVTEENECAGAASSSAGIAQLRGNFALSYQTHTHFMFYSYLLLIYKKWYFK